MSPIAILGLLLALSVAGNAWLFHQRDKSIAAMATAEQLNRDTAASAQACSAGVADLAKSTNARGRNIERALDGTRQQVAWLQGEALKAGQTKPDNPQDLCGSLERYLRGELQKARAVK